MARLDRGQMDSADYPYVLPLETRFDDVDKQGHINNAAVIVFLQEARTRLNDVMGVRDFVPGSYQVVGGMQVEFASELHHPAPVEVHSGIRSIGRTSFTVWQVVRQKGRSAVYAEFAIVLTNGEGGVAIPSAMQAAMAGHSLNL